MPDVRGFHFGKFHVDAFVFAAGFDLHAVCGFRKTDGFFKISLIAGFGAYFRVGVVAAAFGRFGRRVGGLRKKRNQTRTEKGFVLRRDFLDRVHGFLPQ